MKYIKLPYQKKSILGHITSQTVRNKYLLEELPDPEISQLIKNCIAIQDKTKRMQNYELLTNKILNLTGGFNIKNFSFKSPVSR